MSDDKKTPKDVVATYLTEHPDFFEQHPEILEALHLNHESGEATSLIERQVEQLRASNQDLNRQLNRLVQVASDNEQLMSRLHRLTLELMTINSRQEFFDQLNKSLLEDFNADIVQVCLFDEGPTDEGDEQIRTIAPDDPALEPFRAHLEKSRAICGRLSEGKLEFLFGNKGRWVQSSALVPLGEKGADGMLAIGSSDPARFYPGMGTLFLELLADVISTRLSRSEPTARRRSA